MWKNITLVPIAQSPVVTAELQPFVLMPSVSMSYQML